MSWDCLFSCLAMIAMVMVVPSKQSPPASLSYDADPFVCFWGDTEGVVLGFSAAYLEGKSVQECLLECLKAALNKKYVCKSVAFFDILNSPECSLSQESKKTRPDNIIQKDVKNITPQYYENRCLPRNFFGHDPLYAGEVEIKGKIGNVVGKLVFSQASRKKPVYVTGIVTNLPTSSEIVLSMYVKSSARDSDCAKLADTEIDNFVEEGDSVRELVRLVPGKDGLLIIPLQPTDLQILGPLGALESVVMVEQYPFGMDSPPFDAKTAGTKEIIACGITKIISNHTYEELAALVPVDDLGFGDKSSSCWTGPKWITLVLAGSAVVAAALAF